MIKFNNDAIESAVVSALNMTHSVCDGCGEQHPIGDTQRWAYEYIVCPACVVLCRSGRLSFHKDEYAYDDMPRCAVCDSLMPVTTYRVLDGVTTVLYQAVDTCSLCS